MSKTLHDHGIKPPFREITKGSLGTDAAWVYRDLISNQYSLFVP
jgi:hypothetical protein